MRKLVLLFILLSCYTQVSAQEAVQRIDGFNVMPAFNPVEENYATELQELGVGWVSLVTYIYGHPSEPRLGYEDRPQKWGETIDGLREMVRMAQEKGLKVMLKPSIWIPNVGWPGGINFSKKADWEIWEAQYRKHLFEIVAVAQEFDVEMVCIGTEIKESVTHRSNFWHQLIADIRCDYSGALTYAANWDDFESVDFWPLLDYVGIDAYFPLSQSDTPSREELDRAWKPVIKKMDKYFLKNRQPILFTEYGYRSIDKACWRQWEIEWLRNEDALPNFEAQQLGYQSLLDNCAQQEWFAGGFVWYWKAETQYYNSEEDNSYSPQGKPVMKFLRDYFSPTVNIEP